MAKVVLDMAMSLDGFIAGSNTEDHGLHNYFFSPSGPTREVTEQGFKTTGTIIMGMQAYEFGGAQDGFADNPYEVPTVFHTHHVLQTVSKGAEAFIFVTHGTESALEEAKAVTGSRDIVIGGGANIAEQYLRAGLLDEIQTRLVHRLFSEGVLLFDDLESQQVELERIRVVDSPGVTHLQFRVRK